MVSKCSQNPKIRDKQNVIKGTMPFPQESSRRWIKKEQGQWVAGCGQCSEFSTVLCQWWMHMLTSGQSNLT